MWSENVGASSHPVAKLLTLLLLLITSSSSLTSQLIWLLLQTICRYRQRNERKRKAASGVRNVCLRICGWVSLSWNHCSVFLLGHRQIWPSNSWSVTSMACPPSHSLDSFIMLFEHGQKKLINGDKTQFSPSVSAFIFLRVLQLLVNLFILKSFEEQSSDWSVVFAQMCKKRCALKQNDLTFLQILPKAASSKSRLHLNRHEVV